jgi:hypothetical protein
MNLARACHGSDVDGDGFCDSFAGSDPFSTPQRWSGSFFGQRYGCGAKTCPLVKTDTIGIILCEEF